MLTQSSLDTADVRNLQGKFFNCDIDFLIDTGSSVSVLSMDFVKANHLQSACVPVSHAVCIADGREVIYDKRISGPLECQGHVIESNFFVAPKLPVMGILGMNFLNKFESLNLGNSGPDLFLPLLPSCVSGFEDIFDKPMEKTCLKTEPDRIINLEENAKPHQARLRKFAPWEEDFLKQEIPRLLKNKIIRPSNSSWRHFPVI